MAGPIDLNQLAVDALRRTRDAAYVAVGLSVLGTQRLQARRREVARAAVHDDRVVQLRDGVAAGARQIAGWVDGALVAAASTLEPLEERLPVPARELAGLARASMSALGAQLRQGPAARS